MGQGQNLALVHEGQGVAGEVKRLRGDLNDFMEDDGFAGLKRFCGSLVLSDKGIDYDADREGFRTKIKEV